MLASTIQEMCGFLASQVGHFSDESFFKYSIFGIGASDNQDFRMIEDVLSKKWDIKKEAEKLKNEGFSLENLSKTLTKKTRKDTEYFLVGVIIFSSSSKIPGEINILCEFVRGVFKKDFLIANLCLDYVGNNYHFCEETRNWRNGIKIISNIIKEYEKSPMKFLENKI